MKTTTLTCSGCGVPFERPTNEANRQLRKNPWKPSLDRIDSSLGYVRGNVRFIVSIANLCKNGWGDAEVVAFCKAVIQHQPA